MTRTELLEAIRNGESSGIELKRDGVTSHDFAKELVAFLNYEGGTILLGVDDDGEISGVQRENVEEWVMSICRDIVRPPVIPFFEVIRDAEPGKDVIAVRVSAGYGVHSVWRNGRDLYYIRVGSTSRDASKEELARLFQQRGAFRGEISPVSGAGIDDLDLRRLRDYFLRIRRQEVPEPSDRNGWQQLLFNVELIVEGGITLGTLLLFGRNPYRFVPQSSIDAVAFPGIEKDYAARERVSLRGALTPLLTEDGDLVEPGLIEKAVDFVRRNTGVSATLVDGTRRVERFDYPESAVREAIVNALVHRDYLLSGTDTELAIYSDRLEVVSAGRLPNGITPDRMRAGARAARNPMLKDILRDYGYLEHMGMGVRLKIVKGMQEHNGTEPALVEEGERFRVTLYR